MHVDGWGGTMIKLIMKPTQTRQDKYIEKRTENNEKDQTTQHTHKDHTRLDLRRQDQTKEKRNG